MSIKKISKEQPDKFEFTLDNLEKTKKVIKKYPDGKQQSAVMSLLYLSQKQNNNWIPLAAIKYIGRLLEMPYIKVYEIATFYTMYNLTPVGHYFIQVCTTTPCMIMFFLVDLLQQNYYIYLLLNKIYIILYYYLTTDSNTILLLIQIPYFIIRTKYLVRTLKYATPIGRMPFS